MFEELIKKYPDLAKSEKDIDDALNAIIKCYENGGKLLICGNGGSCADSEHIVGELMKGFLKKRPLTEKCKSNMKKNCPSISREVLDKLQYGLPAIALADFNALNSAFSNDVDPTLTYAQSVFALGNKGDILIAISTSGNAENCNVAATVGKSIGLTVIGLTGKLGGNLCKNSDICIKVPETETFKVQELHLPVYHYLCAAVEKHFFNE
ncbi:MAG: SIS domain-containing protein [Clostridia bacterium]|nr:SIS domain-containing protein [Clostridia bacterium]